MLEQYNITVATANAHRGRLIRHPNGLESLEEAGVLLLQEVSPRRDNLHHNLKRFGFTAVALAERCDLAIAVRRNIAMRSVRRDSLRTKLGRAVANRLSGYETVPPTFRQPGILATELEIEEGYSMIAATSHPSVPLKPIARGQQVSNMPDTLAHEYYQGRMVFGGDMNHWPGPRMVDKRMQVRAGFKAVDLGGNSTWRPDTNEHPPLVALGKIAMMFGIDISGQLDAMYYRGALTVQDVQVIDIESDHRGVMARFCFVE